MMFFACPNFGFGEDAKADGCKNAVFEEIASFHVLYMGFDIC